MKKINFIICILIFLGCNTKSRTDKTELKSDKGKIMEMNKQNPIELSREIIDSLSTNDIIYAEVAEGGAMGNVGGIIIYILENKQLIRYEASLFKNEEIYSEAQKLLLKHQNKFDYDNLKVDKILFDYHYGGMGNHVFVNKKVALEKGEDFFTFSLDDKKYNVFCSVQGVFYSVANSIENSKKNK